MGWAVTGCARKRCLLLVLGSDWQRLGLASVGGAWIWHGLVGDLRVVGIVRQKATAIELVRTRGI